jgi:hypothetical protein
MKFLLACLLAWSGAAQSAEPKTRLVFSIGQGFGHGIVANGNVEALNRMVTALEPLRAKNAQILGESHRLACMNIPKERGFKRRRAEAELKAKEV